MKISLFILYNDCLLVLGDTWVPFLFFQCKFCGREGTVTMISGRGKPLTQEDSESGKYSPMMLFDCRGYEPVDFIFGDGWKVESVSFQSLSFHFVIQHEALYIFLSRIICGCKGYGAIQVPVYLSLTMQLYLDVWYITFHLMYSGIVNVLSMVVIVGAASVTFAEGLFFGYWFLYPVTHKWVLALMDYLLTFSIPLILEYNFSFL